MITEKTIRDLSELAGVDTAPESLRRYETFNPLMENRNLCRCAIIPKDAAELQAVIRRAREDGVGLVPVSSAGPHIRGGIACDVDHAMVDLSGWKKIPWIDRRNRVCLIEPGVTYSELNETLEKEGMTLPTPLAPRSGKSVLASVVDREPHIWPKVQWDMQDPVASTEFIYGTGELFRSGAAGGPGTLEEQRRSKGAQKMPMGPGQSDFQRILIGAQGSMGIMTWITLRTELRPSVERPMVAADDRLARILAYVYEAQRPWLGEHSFVLNRTAAALLMTWAGPSNYDRVRKSIPEYICLQNIAGFERLPRERLGYQLEELRDMAGGNGLRLAESAGEIDAAHFLEIARTPCAASDWRHSLRGHCLSIFFLSLLDKSEQYIEIVYETAAAMGIDRDRVGVYLQPVVQNHACHMEFMVPFDPSSATEIVTMNKFEAEATGRLMQAKAFFSRPYGAAARSVFENNPGNTEMLRIIKSMFDPGKILSPGKFGL